MKPPDVERVTRKPVEIESLTDNHEKQKKNQDCKLKKEKKRKKQTQRERERAEHATTVHAKHDTTVQCPESKKGYTIRGAVTATSKCYK
jgi:ribosomal 30S subunit maturation factor RimM